jgi:KRAB domain-containing zinc finger protein
MVTQDYTKVLTETLVQFQLNGYLCDTVLVAEDGQLKAHGAVLAAASPVFKAALRVSYKPTEHVVLLPGIQLHVLMIALHFAYTGDFVVPQEFVSPDHITKLLLALSQLGLKVDKCMNTNWRDAPEKLAETETSRVSEQHADSVDSSDTLMIRLDRTLLQSTGTVTGDVIQSRIHKKNKCKNATSRKRWRAATSGVENIRIDSSVDSSSATLEEQHHSELFGKDGITGVHFSDSLHDITYPLLRGSDDDNRTLSVKTAADRTSDDKVSTVDDHCTVDDCQYSDVCRDSGLFMSVESDGVLDTLTPLTMNIRNEITSVCASEISETVWAEADDAVLLNGDETLELACAVELLSSNSSPGTLLDQSLVDNSADCAMEKPSSKESASKYHTSQVMCEVCGRLVGLAGIGRHMLTHDTLNRNKCPECGIVCSNGFNLRRHLKRHTDDRPFVCELCGERFIQKSSLLDHRWSRHRDSIDTDREASPFHCKICNVGFFSRSHMRRHRCGIDTRSGPARGRGRPSHLVHKCVYCLEAMPSASALVVHVRSKHGFEKPFGCITCGAKFKTSVSLLWHNAKHTGNKRSDSRHRCPHCVRSFEHLPQVYAHMRVQHGRSQNDEPLYRCAVCSKTLHSRNALRLHELTHTDFKPYQCTICGKQLRQSTHLRLHMTVHTGERQHKCQVCDKSYKARIDLRIHCRRVHQFELPKYEKGWPVTSVVGEAAVESC